MIYLAVLFVILFFICFLKRKHLAMWVFLFLSAVFLVLPLRKETVSVQSSNMGGGLISKPMGDTDTMPLDTNNLFVEHSKIEK